jgi:hypothetical protein
MVGGMTVFSGMFASSCVAVLFVPSFFVIVQRFEEWLLARKRARAARAAAKEGDVPARPVKRPYSGPTRLAMLATGSMAPPFIPYRQRIRP